MKKLCTLLALVLLLTCIPMVGCTTEPKPNPPTDFEYEVISDGGITITKYIGEADVVVIPSEIDGHAVKSIGYGAFNDVELTDTEGIPKSTVTSVTIPDTVIAIAPLAFAACEKLTEVKMSSQLTKIGERAFSGCNALTSIDLSMPSLTEIHNEAFLECTSLTHVDLGPNIKIIKDSAFQSCTALTSITIPKSLETWGQGTFCSTIALTSLTLEDGLQSIGAEAFFNASVLETVTIPASVRTIGDSAFSGCDLLDEVIFLGDAPDTIGKFSFGNPNVPDIGADIPPEDLNNHVPTIYYDPATSGWDTTPLRDIYTLVPIE